MIDSVLELIKHYDLGGVVRYILENNTAQALPYHGFNHALRVAYYANEAYFFEKERDAPMVMIVAALFHDFDHSGGFFTDDSNNTRLATAGLTRATSLIHPHIWADLHVATALIKELEFKPNGPKEIDLEKWYGETKEWREHYEFMCHCLRDADMMQYCEEFVLDSYIGIKAESFRHMSHKDCLVQGINFLKSIKYQTSYGKTVGQQLLDTSIDRLKYFSQLVYPQN